MKAKYERYPNMPADERAARIARNGNGKTILRKVTNRFTEGWTDANGESVETDDELIHKKVGAGVVVWIKANADVEPSVVIRAFRRYCTRVGINSIMAIEFDGGAYNGRGVKTDEREPSPTAFQVTGPRSALKAIREHWTVLRWQFRTNERAPAFPRDANDAHCPIPGDVSATVAKNIRRRFLSRNEREARENREDHNKIHVNNADSPHHDDARRVAEGNAHTLIMLAYETSELSPGRIRVLVDAMTEFLLKKGRAPDSREEFEATL